MKKILVLGLVLILGLAVVGAGYAGWTQNLYINGTVSTGTVDVEWSAADGTLLNDGTATGTALISTVSADNDDMVTITVLNAYPGYTGSAELTATNTGSIPVTLATSGSGAGFSISDDPLVTVAASGGTYVYTVSVALPDDATVPEDTVNAYSVSYTIVASQ